MDDRATGVRVEGLREFRRDIKRLEPEADKGLQREIKQASDKVAGKARSDARTFKRTGKYAASIKTYSAKSGVAIGSRLPQAGVLHWGGTITPRGVPILFERRAVVYDAAEAHMDDLTRSVERAVEQAARRVGFKT